MKNKKKILLCVDPQNDFIEGGSLAVAGGTKALKNLASFITEMNHNLNDIWVSLDSHQKFAIFHTSYFMDNNGNHPIPYTKISYDDVVNGTWKVSRSASKKPTLHYLEQVKLQKRTHVLFPDHCLIGTYGWLPQADFNLAVADWGSNNKKNARYFFKGQNPNTEHFSMFEAVVQNRGDKKTILDYTTIRKLRNYDEIIVGGLALGICLKETIQSILTSYVSYIGGGLAGKIVLLVDCTASISGMELEDSQYLDLIKSHGVRVMTSLEYLKGTN